MENSSRKCPPNTRPRHLSFLTLVNNPKKPTCKNGKIRHFPLRLAKSLKEANFIYSSELSPETLEPVNSRSSGNKTIS